MIRQIVGNYKILEKIGEGGMGTVYRGVDILLEREVAIKSLRPELTHDQHLIERFRAEAVALARLNHTHIVTLYSFFPHDKQFFMALEFVRGETLDKLIKRRGAIPWQQAVPLICQALSGLEHAHSLKVIHRDIKPANIILMPAGTLKLMDFGIARILETSRLTRTGHLFGTPEYMSPEQIQGRDTDARIDIYSMGIVLYKILTGHIPFERDSEFELLKSQVEERPPPLRTWMPQLPVLLEEAVLRALVKAPAERFQSAAEFRAALERILEAAPTRQKTGQRSPALPETRFDDTVSSSGSIPPVPVTFPQVSEAPLRQSRESHLAYLKRYPGVATLLVIVGMAATLIGIEQVVPKEGTATPVSESATAVSSQKQPAAPPQKLVQPAPTPPPEKQATGTPPEESPQPVALRPPVTLLPETPQPLPSTVVPQPEQPQKMEPENPEKKQSKPKASAVPSSRPRPEPEPKSSGVVRPKPSSSLKSSSIRKASPHSHPSHSIPAGTGWKIRK